MKLESFILPIIVFVLPPRLAAQQSQPAVEVFALPLGRSWGALADVTTSVAESYWKPDGGPGAGPNDNFTRERRIALIPSIVRLWRTDQFSIYGGGGVGFEHRRQRTHFRPIIARGELGEPILVDEFQDVTPSSTDAMLVLRAGAIVSLSRAIVFRADLSFLPRYVDEKASKSLAAGIGYRF